MSNAAYPAAHNPAVLARPPFRIDLAGLLRRWLARRKERRTLQELKDLPPYLLNDIGLLEHIRSAELGLVDV